MGHQKENARNNVIERKESSFSLPLDRDGKTLRICDYYGDNVFDIARSSLIPDKIKLEVLAASKSLKKALPKEHVQTIANAVTEWALSHGATHFCHWFQPLTGSTAEKHDSFLSFNKAGEPIEKLLASQLMQGEPDASSFPNGGSRSTFEARGYTSWDLTSPMFLLDGANGKTLCIPTAFVSYHGDALDIKTPLLRSISKLSAEATRFLNIIGEKDVQNVVITAGAEQEYFLIDKTFYYQRPDLIMTGRTLFGSLSTKNQQLDDHYFGIIPERVLAFMQELDFTLHKLGIPSKTRHNEVAPGQFELAPIFEEANISADHNQVTMAQIKKIAEKHDFVAILHEKPFAGINGSGKHVNWSMASDTGINLLEPGDSPHSNMRFLSTVAIIVKAVHDHAEMLRASIASASNDHRLGANEAPPSIISVFLGETIDKIYSAMLSEKSFNPEKQAKMDMGAEQLVGLFKDNTDRNRTSPFAFTGNKFEFRAVGSTASIGLPLSVLNGAVLTVLESSNIYIEKEIASGKSVNDALVSLIKNLLNNSKQVIFNGDGYSKEWEEEAEKRGLPNLRTTADALKVLSDSSKTSFLMESGIYTKLELETRYHVLLERYNSLREIEFKTFINMVNQSVIPAVINYKEQLSSVIKRQKDIGLESIVEVEIYKQIVTGLDKVFANTNNLKNAVTALPTGDDSKRADIISSEVFPLSELVAENCNEIEDLIPEYHWTLPKYKDLLFIR